MADDNIVANSSITTSNTSITTTASVNKKPRTKRPPKEEHWLKAYWRPCMGWLYMLICFMDFVGFPFLSMVLPLTTKVVAGQLVSYTAWTPITLTNGGIIHVSFGAILGVAAWSRTQEKRMINDEQ